MNPEVHTEEEHEDERPALRSLGPGASDGAPGEVDDIDDEARLLAMCRGNLDSLYPVAERAVYWLWFLSGYGDDARDVIDAAEATGERFRHPFDVLEAGLIALRSGMRRSDIERDLLDDRRRRAAAQ